MRKWYPLMPIAAAFVFSAAVYDRLPARVPVHWGFSGEVNGYGGRLEGAFALPLLALGLWLLMRLLPRIDPRREHYAKFEGAYDLAIDAIITLLVLSHVMILGAALGGPVPVARVGPALVGLCLLVIGNVLPRARSNWWFGIRTPWTLSSERVWVRTHRVGGYLFVASGIMLVAAAVPDLSWLKELAFATVAIAVVGSVVYSYFAWRQEASR